METKENLKLIMGIFAIFIMLPMWYFLIYSILSAIEVDRLVWFIYWFYVPVGFILTIMKEVIGD